MRHHLYCIPVVASRPYQYRDIFWAARSAINIFGSDRNNRPLEYQLSAWRIKHLLISLLFINILRRHLFNRFYDNFSFYWLAICFYLFRLFTIMYIKSNSSNYIIFIGIIYLNIFLFCFSNMLLYSALIFVVSDNVKSFVKHWVHIIVTFWWPIINAFMTVSINSFVSCTDE